ncbi:aldehyde dehydrogenase family protein [Aurantibacillus circumpalustris]|uniref:aldehyde dehydrogenase family protein n=1 Tax=Aurantibacillus circumpalustris TaxID=3036359 RepID=UPI00295B330F|nr:aldehyde dehydrogenase family protein [Aurantibacillus circumpalustris]
MNTYKLFCAGEFIETSHVHKIKNKYTNDLFSTTYLADEKLLDKAIKAAENAKYLCKELSSLEKYMALKFISDELEKNKNYLAEILCIESAKPLRYALVEIERSIQTFLIAAEECKRLPKDYMSLDWTQNGKGKEGLVNYFPIGIVAGISPFNFPMNLAVHKIAPAIAAGCPIILKPASSTPLSTLELAKIIAKTNLPKGAVSILPMNRKTGNLLVTDERIQLLSFTGSPEIGWELKKQSGKKKVVLELGGNAGVIVTKSANLKKIINCCMMGAFSYSGQICIHAQRFFVHTEIFKEFMELIRIETLKLISGDPLKDETSISVMIDEENAIRTEQWVNEALEKGAKLICGGKRKVSFYDATILTQTKKGMKVYDEEVFGPVICIEEYNGKIEDGVQKINDTKFGLQCGIFTDSVAELDYAFKYCEVGGVIHNNVPTLRFDQMPYGGIKESGLGREGVKYALLDMLEPKVLVK